jgi:SAM-dependent methyltransferase
MGWLLCCCCCCCCCLQVVNVDISPVVIEQMRLMDQLPGQTWEVADCRSMPEYDDASFGSVLDKGTLDAVLCSSHGTADAAAYINEVYRLLVPGGVFLLISLGQPPARLAALKAAPAMHTSAPLPYLSADLQQRAAASSAAAAAAAASISSSESGRVDSSVRHWQWESVEVYLLPKPSLYLQSEASLTGKPIVAHMPHSDKDMPVEWLGPFRAGAELDAFIAQQALDLREFFTAFACTKATTSADAAELNS